MQTRRCTAAAVSAFVGLLVTASPTFAQSAFDVNKTNGLMLGINLNIATISSNDGADANAKRTRELGVGLGGTVGWGLTRWLMLYGNAELAFNGEAGVDQDAYALTHVDAGLRFSLPSPKRRPVPYLNVAHTTRSATSRFSDSASLKGTGLTVGGGVMFFFTSKWTLDVSMQATSGKFERVADSGEKLADLGSATSARLNVGMKFFPHIGKN